MERFKNIAERLAAIKAEILAIAEEKEQKKLPEERLTESEMLYIASTYLDDAVEVLESVEIAYPDKSNPAEGPKTKNDGTFNISQTGTV